MHDGPRDGQVQSGDGDTLNGADYVSVEGGNVFGRAGSWLGILLRGDGIC